MYSSKKKHGYVSYIFFTIFTAVRHHIEEGKTISEHANDKQYYTSFKSNTDNYNQQGMHENCIFTFSCKKHIYKYIIYTMLSPMQEVPSVE